MNKWVLPGETILTILVVLRIGIVTVIIRFIFIIRVGMACEEYK